MKRALAGLIVTLLAVVVNVVPAYASVDDFVIKDFQADYYLAKDSEGRSTLKTVELITAEFPNFDQNHGIERAIPKTYDEHSVSLKIDTVTDSQDKSINYTTYTSNDNLVLRIGDADRYVHGLVTYKITYTQRDVTGYFSDNDSDEFYWDVNGGGWGQAIEKVTASIHIDSALAGNLNGAMSCYQGAFGSSTLCNIERNGNTIVADSSSFGPYENMTIAVGFQSGTFNAFQKSATDEIIALIIIAVIVLAIVLCLVDVILFIYFLVLRSKINDRKRSIAPEYLPPKGVDVVLSALIINENKRWVAASFVDLAVRHKVKIIEREEGMFKKKAYSAELVSVSGLSESENKIVQALFGNNYTLGAKHDFESSPDYSLYSSLKAVRSSSETDAKQAGFYEKTNPIKRKMTILTVIMGISILLTWPIGMLFTIVSAVILSNTKPLLEKGLDLRDYLDGLKMYITAAEEDRLKMLQSPQGAEKVSIKTDDKAKMVKLYERLLPYAVLFGNEKQWAKSLGEFYEQNGQNPDWYVGNSAFNAVIFANAVSGFSTSSTTNSYSAPSSSGSGGSGGGGFSGGGGGGGGGGGW